MVRRHRLFANFHTNKLVLIFYELISRLVIAAVTVPLIYASLDLSMRFSGYRYLTAENVNRFLKHPSVFLLPIVLIVFSFCYTLIDISAVAYIQHHAYLDERTDVLHALRFALRNARGIFRKGNRSLLLPVLVTFLYCLLSQIPYLLGSYSVPSKITRFLRHHRYFLLFLFVLLLLAGYRTLKELYAFHYYTLENNDADEAKRRSRALTKGVRMKDLGILIRRNILCFLLYLLFLAVGIFLVLLIGKLFFWSRALQTTTTKLLRVVIAILLAAFNLIGIPLGYLFIGDLFFRRKTEKDEPLSSASEVNESRGITPYEAAPGEKERHPVKRFFRMLISPEGAVLLIALLICGYYTVGTYRGEFNRNVGSLHRMEVTAHRGASRYYPENTMLAFQGAVDAGADWIELDVHESLDGQVFVMHDANFLRTTGVDADAWTLPAYAIRRLDAGTFFSPKYAGEPIPFLEDVIDFADANQIRLNIEIKPSPQEAELEERLVALLQEKDFTDRCVVTSQYYDSIRKVKQLDPNIETVYVMGLAYGNINRLEAADAFSVRHTSITDRLVEKVHVSGKTIYAWTVDSRDDIDRMLAHNVDNIITDDIPLAKGRIQAALTSDPVESYIRLIEKLLRLDQLRQLTAGI